MTDPTRRPAAVVRLVLAVVVAALVATAAGLTSGSPSGAGAAPRLVVESQTAFVDPVGRFDLVLRAEAAPPGATLRVSVHPSVASRGRLRFEETIGGRSLGTPLRSLPPIDVDSAVEFLGALAVAIPVAPSGPAPDGGVTLTAAGVYPVAVALETAEGDTLDAFVTYLVRLPDPTDPTEVADDGAAPALAFAAVVPLTTPPALRSDRTWHIDPDDVTRLGTRATTLAARPEVPLTLAALPQTLAALGEVTGGPPVLDDLRRAAADRQLVSLPWVPIAVGSWAAADLDGALADEVAAGAVTTDAALGAAPTPATTLLDATVDPGGLSLLRDLGTRTVVVPEALLEPLDAAVFTTTLTQPFQLRDAEGGTVAAVAADRGLAARLEATDDPVLAAHLVLADLAVLRLDLEGVERGAALVVPEDAPDAFLETLLAGLAEPHATPLVAATTVDELVARVPGATTRAGAGDGGTPLVRSWRFDEPQSLGRYPIERRATEEGLDGYRSLLGDGAPTAPLEALVQASGDRRLSTAQQNEMLLTVQGLIGDEIARITLPEGQSITLTAEEGTLPLVVDNALDAPVRVRLALESDRLEFPDGDTVEATLEPGTNRVEVRVRSRASGAFPLDVQMTSPDQVLELDETRVTVRSTAISGLGLVLSLAAGLFLAIWWIRHWRTTRRARRLVSPAHPSTRPAPRSADETT